MKGDSLSPSLLDFDDKSQPYSSELATANFWWLTTRAFHVGMPDSVNEISNEVIPVKSVYLMICETWRAGFAVGWCQAVLQAFELVLIA